MTILIVKEICMIMEIYLSEYIVNFHISELFLSLKLKDYIIFERDERK